ncbi:hypothetical protein SLEP1_g41696 [Rubroshorea leprosula]|uniref:Uncharacterized protein n=1 Tax=Rubroshorea leprosula TaxID=152421 RepID=A0AAV5L8C7_9ROSI|nr:hypothetical protein SLEP1_g41696 [Rubroshorea leprosula]
MTQDTSSDEASVVMAGSILQISVMVISNKFSVLGPDTQEERLRGPGIFLLEIAISVMDVKMHGLFVDAAIIGIMTPPLAELQVIPYIITLPLANGFYRSSSNGLKGFE